MSGDAHGSLTLRARHVVPIAGPPIANGWLRIEHGRIAGLGSGSARGRSVDLGEAIVIPGLVNAHTHLEFSDCERPLDTAGGLPGWIGRIVALRRGRAVDDAAGDRSRAIARGLAESAAAGATSVGDIATSVEGFLSGTRSGAAAGRVEAAAQSPGPRVRVFREALGLSVASQAAAFRRLSVDLGRLASTGIPAGISPHAPYTVGRRLGRRLIAGAVARNLPVMMHLAESREEAALVTTGGGPFRELLAGLGAWPDGGAELLPAAEWISRLARAPRGILVHGTFLPEDPEAMARLERHRDRIVVAVCPRTTLAMSGKLPPVREFRAAGIRVALGTDGRASNPDLDVRGECRALVEAGLVSPAEAIWMATRQGACALGFERRAGRLAPGFAADIAVLSPADAAGDPFAAAIAATTRVMMTLRRGRAIAGNGPPPPPA